MIEHLKTQWRKGTVSHLEIEYRINGLDVTVYRVLPWNKGLFASVKRNYDDRAKPNGREPLPFAITDLPINSSTKAWLASFPKRVVEDLYIHKKQYDYPFLLKMCNHQRFFELHESNPNLALLIDNHIENQALSFNDYTRFSETKRIKVLDKLGCTGSKSVVKIIDKIAPGIFQVVQEKDFLDCFKHVDAISPMMLMLWDYTTKGLSIELAKQIVVKNSQQQSEMLCGLIKADLKLNEKITDFLSGLTNFSQLLNILKKIDSLPDYVEYMAPPIAEQPGIMAIKTSLALYLEGERMHHCVACGHYLPLQGRHYFYHVTYFGEGYTLHICNVEKSSWVINQCKGKCNAQPPKGLIYKLQLWLADNGQVPVFSEVERQSKRALAVRP